MKLQYQGIDTIADKNATRLHSIIVDDYGSRFYIPLDFELLES